jgi:hypothetical protein
MLYWLCILKPFSVQPKDVAAIEKMGAIYKFHNEFISYTLLTVFLKAYNQRITIIEDKDLFHYFLYDLHTRNLSRSSLEFFMHGFIEPIK